jgi:hypothetical protein
MPSSCGMRSTENSVLVYNKLAPGGSAFLSSRDRKTLPRAACRQLQVELLCRRRSPRRCLDDAPVVEADERRRPRSRQRKRSGFRPIQGQWQILCLLGADTNARDRSYNGTTSFRRGPWYSSRHGDRHEPPGHRLRLSARPGRQTSCSLIRIEFKFGSYVLPSDSSRRSYNDSEFDSADRRTAACRCWRRRTDRRGRPAPSMPGKYVITMPSQSPAMRRMMRGQPR